MNGGLDAPPGQLFLKVVAGHAQNVGVNAEGEYVEGVDHSARVMGCLNTRQASEAATQDGGMPPAPFDGPAESLEVNRTQCSRYVRHQEVEPQASEVIPPVPAVRAKRLQLPS